MIIKALNNQAINASKTYLSTDVVAAGTSLPVKNINNFTTSWVAQIGETGEERTEVKLISGTPATGTVNLTAGMTYNHPKDTPVYCYKYDKVVFEVSTAGTAGTATALTNGTIGITPDRFSLDGASYTIFDDISGSTGYAYKVKFRNSVLAVDSSESDWIIPLGYSFFSLAKMRERAKAKTVNLNISSDTVDTWINEWHEQMVNALIDTNRDYAIGTTEITFTDGQQYGTVTASDFKFPRKVVFIAGGTQEMTSQDLNTVSVNVNDSWGVPTYYFRGDNVIGRDNSSVGGTMRIDYYKIGTQMVYDNDSLPIPMRGYTKYYVDYVRDQAALMDKGDITANEINTFEVKWEGWLNKFSKEMAPRQYTNAETIQITSPLELQW